MTRVASVQPPPFVSRRRQRVVVRSGSKLGHPTIELGERRQPLPTLPGLGEDARTPTLISLVPPPAPPANDAVRARHPAELRIDHEDFEWLDFEWRDSTWSALEAVTPTPVSGVYYKPRPTLLLETEPALAQAARAEAQSILASGAFDAPGWSD